MNVIQTAICLYDLDSFSFTQFSQYSSDICCDFFGFWRTRFYCITGGFLLKAKAHLLPRHSRGFIVLLKRQKKPLFFHFIHGKTRAIWDEYITLLVQCWYQFGIKTPFFSLFEGFLRSKTLDSSDFLLEGQTTVVYSSLPLSFFIPTFLKCLIRT